MNVYRVARPPRPKRRFVVRIEVGGDTWEDTQRLVAEVLEHVHDHGQHCSLVHGGPRAGAFVEIKEAPEMTHERYHAELEAYLEAQRDHGR